MNYLLVTALNWWRGKVADGAIKSTGQANGTGFFFIIQTSLFFFPSAVKCKTLFVASAVRALTFMRIIIFCLDQCHKADPYGHWIGLHNAFTLSAQLHIRVVAVLSDYQVIIWQKKKALHRTAVRAEDMYTKGISKLLSGISSLNA